MVGRFSLVGKEVESGSHGSWSPAVLPMMKSFTWESRLIAVAILKDLGKSKYMKKL
jgi:hypothetical protein